MGVRIIPTDSRADPALRRLVYRVLWPGFNGTTVPDWLARALESGLGGVLYFAHNFDADDCGQPARLSRSLHAFAPEALLGVDEEGGIVTRLEAAEGSPEPGNAVLGRVDDIGATRRSGCRIGRTVAHAGIDIDLAPVVDVNSDPRNPVIGVRSFGADPGLVCRHAAAMVQGIQETGVACCIKHFPGYGDVINDPHLIAPTVRRTAEQFASIHLPPFLAAIRAGAKCVMAAHVTVPYLGPDVATINPEALGMLREQYGFEGVIICDALDMGAIAKSIGQRRGGVRALLAGNDMLCIGNPADHRGRDEDDFIRVREGLFDALDDGSLPVEVLEHAVERICSLVAWRGTSRHDDRCVQSSTGDESGEPERLAAQALEIHGDVVLDTDGPVLMVDARDPSSPVVGKSANRFVRVFRAQALSVDVVKARAGDGLDRLADRVTAHQGDVLLFVGHCAQGSDESMVAKRLLTVRPGIILVQTDWPAAAPPCGRVIQTFGDALPNVKATYDALTGQHASI